MTMLQSIRTVAKTALAPLIYRYPPFGLQPERLATYLNGLLDRIHVPGDVAEVGCNVGGTAAIAARMLRQQGWQGRYICYDTFGGFIEEQFNGDYAAGTETERRFMFSANSMGLVRKVLSMHDAPHVELVRGDVTRVPDSALSDLYMVVLLDIDLADPTYQALKKFWPRVAPGGAIFVDDCPEGYAWKAREGYARFCGENGLPEIYKYGFGVLERPAPEQGASLTF